MCVYGWGSSSHFVAAGGQALISSQSGRSRWVSGWAAKLSSRSSVGPNNCYFVLFPMGQSISNMPMSQCVDTFWLQQKVPFTDAKALSEDELYDLICRWQWVCFSGLTHADTAKPIVEWVWIAVRFLQGYSVFWGLKFGPDVLAPRWKKQCFGNGDAMFYFCYEYESRQRRRRRRRRRI